jgi:GNAT superfamily N-acetyltransferase
VRAYRPAASNQGGDGLVQAHHDATGFCAIKGDELSQLFVSPRVRSSGVAATLIADAEKRLSQQGVETAWLACVIGNHRAARFYERSGWHLAGAIVDPAETSSGPFPVDVWRYEKRLAHST